MMEDGRRKLGVGRQKTEDGRRETGDRSRKTEDGSLDTDLNRIAATYYFLQLDD